MNHIKNWVIISPIYTNIVRKIIFKLNNQSLSSKHINHHSLPYSFTLDKSNIKKNENPYKNT